MYRVQNKQTNIQTNKQKQHQQATTTTRNKQANTHRNERTSILQKYIYSPVGQP